MTPEDAKRISALRKAIAADNGIISRASDSIVRLRSKQMSCGSSPSERAKAKRAGESVSRLDHKRWTAERRIQLNRAAIRALGGKVREL